MAYVITKTDFNKSETHSSHERYTESLEELKAMFKVHKEGILKRTGMVVGNYKKGWFMYVSKTSGLAIRFRVEVAK